MTTPIKTDELRDSLLAVGECVIEEVSSAVASSEIVIKRQQYIIRRDPTLWYTVDPTLMNFEAETTEENYWNWHDLDSFLTDHVLTKAVYGQAIQAFQDAGQGTDFIRRFLSRVAYGAALGNVIDMGQYVATLLRDVRDSPQEYEAKLWLTGINPTDGTISISDRLSIRSATKKDLQQKITFEAAEHGFAGLPTQIFFSCIAECRVLARRPVELQRYIDKLATVLCLFRLGSVSVPRFDYQAESFSMFASGSFGAPQRAPRLQYALSANDGAGLLQALQVLMPLLPSTFDVPKPAPNFMSTALDWYRESLLAQGSVEGTIAWLVACLEALFLGDNPTTEIAYRLTHRVVALLRCLGLDPLEVRLALKAAYDVRSRHVHGAVPKKLSHERLTALHRQVAEYARISLLAWTQMINRKRTDVLNTLEDSLIDATANIRLQSWCDQIQPPKVQ